MPPAAPILASPRTRARPAETDLRGLLGILARQWRSIAGLTVASLALASVYLAITPPTYSASTTLFIDPRPKKIVSDDTAQAGLGSDLALLESQVAIIRSDAVLSRVVDQMKLDADPEFASAPEAGLRAAVKSAIGLRPAETNLKAQALAALAQRVVVKRAQKTYVVEIEAWSSQPVKAARLTGAIVDAYLADQSAAKSEEARRANTMIDGRLGELRERLRMAETRLDDFRKFNRILTSEGGTVGEQQLTRLNTELITARAQTAETKARFDEVTAAARAGNPDAITDPAKTGLLQRLREQLAQVARREASLASQLLPRHPVLIDIRSQTTEIKAQISAELKRLAASARSDFQIAEARERELAKTLDAAKTEVGRTNTAQIKQRELEGEVAASRELLRVFLTRSKETDEQQRITAPDARVISPASVPTRPSRPVPALILGLGLIAGVGAGIARALTRDHFDRSMRSVRDVADATGLEAIASLPAVTPAGKRRRWLASGRPQGPIETSFFASYAIALTRGGPPSAARYRRAILAILARLVNESGPQHPPSLLVTSPHSGSGTAAVAFSLAYAATAQGSRVLLIDAASTHTELSEALAGPTPMDRPVRLDDRDDLASIATRDPQTGMSVLPIGLADLASLSLLQRQRLIRGLRDLAADYDLLVIDGGGVLDDDSAQIMLPLATRAVILAGIGETDAATLEAAATQLDPTRARLAGVVLSESA